MIGEDFVRERTRAMQPAPEPSGSGSHHMPDSVGTRLQSVAGTRLAAQLGRLTEEADAGGESQLQALMGMCTVALSCKAALLDRAQGDEAKLECSWRTNGAVSGRR